MNASSPLPSRLATADLALASVRSVMRAVDTSGKVDPVRIAMAFRSDRLLRVDGEAPSVWSPFSGFWRAGDGWLRTHGNYPHHARALCRGLGMSAETGADELHSLFAAAAVQDSVDRIVAAGGLAVAVRRENPDHDAVLRERPLVEVTRIGGGEPSKPQASRDRAAPLRGIRVLDLTRVIAGPVCTRTLALLGADVLRIDPPNLPEPEWQHFDTGHGKRSTLLDARSPQMPALLSKADVVVLGYRPAALERLGLSPAVLAKLHPGLIIAQLSAWGLDHPDRAGFDSLVQAESGIAMIESPDGERPGALPAQALDHSAGYLLAAAICETLARREREGGTWHISTSLRRVAAELLGMPRRDEPQPEREIDPAIHSQQFTISGRSVATAAPALPGFSFEAPHAWGGDRPRWRSPRTARE
ncbi:CoA transferase [Microbacterium profundi]|uniref:CoA transferase n=1 Tax=Microbacterium profundi TaxID=450380 RepID=UPI00051A359D|nr:CoA transferase [Microbacterium profundi]